MRYKSRLLMQLSPKFKYVTPRFYVEYVLNKKMQYQRNFWSNGPVSNTEEDSAVVTWHSLVIPLDE